MEKQMYYNFLKTKDRIGGTLKTEVYRYNNEVYKAFSHYARDKDMVIVGYGESDSEEIAVKLSRKDLRKEWKEEQVSNQ
ncbi:hypothetical protein B4102_2170 [Heyndrickxia sporothermodurans]|uniref:Uncharacterized protein n=1 Tax=Heyndrickxia sporothermodurans TaxID=46224 RepID=A0A150LI74_9BACI|nr:hypothetical protein [Heyndrickxia sporothermodurans]KYD11442.1 hypothetical protein B4102_2170 [Heyndrickxia sporothermodurans]